MATADGVEETAYPLAISYCGVCGMPPEYCEFSSNPAKCYEWLKVNLPDEYAAIVGETSEQLEDLAISKKQSRGGKAIRKPKKAVVRAVKISLQTRSKKKNVTMISGLKTCEIDLKKASKQFASHFSCGSSVTGEDEIVVQGDVCDEVYDYILESWPEVEEDYLEIVQSKKR